MGSLSGAAQLLSLDIRMKNYLVLFIGHKQDDRRQDTVQAASYEMTPELYVFYDEKSEVIAQYERRHVAGVRELGIA